MESQLLGPADIRSLATQFGISPTKKLGQNFVHDPNIVRRIVETAQLAPNEHVVEVGPGLGSLTLALLDTAAHVTAIELDSTLARHLAETIEQRSTGHIHKLTIMHRNALEVTRTEVAEPTALVANLPYNVSVPVLLHMLATFPTLRSILVMVQSEVADRLAAQPGSKIYGVPSVKIAYYGIAQRAGTISRKVFWPQPNVESCLIRIAITPPQERPWADIPHTDIFPIIDAAFAQRRKTLRSALTPLLGTSAQVENILQTAQINPHTRGEKLGIKEYAAISRAIKQHTH